jgi:O-acetyl-ADP-ribose deacetylase (regulator of RNase III)
MIKLALGNLLDADVQALVNPVNTEGVMGAGLALQFKAMFPDMYEDYRKFCATNTFYVGQVMVWAIPIEQRRKSQQIIINFPTKQHWRDASRIEFISSGLHSLRDLIHTLSLRSVAVPALGCGNGGLPWVEVYKLINGWLGDALDTTIFVYRPWEVTRDNYAYITS